MRSPVFVLPNALQTLLALNASVEQGRVPSTIIHLVELRASQINGCSVCVDMHAHELRKSGESDERLFAVSAWRDAPYFTDAERAALALAEAVTRLSDREDPVPDAIWHEAEQHFDEAGRAALLLAIAKINVWNRLNVATKQPADGWRAKDTARGGSPAVKKTGSQ
jgi:AhpD family alkylhydroperoxidase